MPARPRPDLHLFLDDAPLGEYVGLLDINVGPYGEGERIEGKIDLSSLLLLRQHLDNTIDGLVRRKISDSVCGDCSRCSNTRMVDEIPVGSNRRQHIHCPTCRPLLDEARTKGLL